MYLKKILELLEFPNCYEHYKNHETLGRYLQRQIYNQIETLKR